MNTFLKILLLLVAAVIAIKLLPLTLFVGLMIGLTLVIALALGVSAAAVIVVGLVAVAAMLAPIWIPVLLILGVIALVRRGTRPAAVNS